MQTIADPFVWKLFLLQSGVNYRWCLHLITICDSHQMLAVPFSILQMLAKLFYELVLRCYCLHFSDCIMDLEQAVFYCSSNCSYLNEEKQYPDNSMYSLMFLASILVTNYQATFFRRNTTKLLAQVYHLICILWLQLQKTFWTPGYVFDK